ncbi:hypothetical protein Hanom_Chr10g00906991 [Helianthus anomalus]
MDMDMYFDMDMGSRIRVRIWSQSIHYPVTLDEVVRAREIIGLDTPLARLFQTALEDSYCEIMIEFLSSFIYASHPKDYVEDPDHVVHEITFRLADQEFGMSLRDFVVRSGLYTEAKLDTDVYT